MSEAVAIACRGAFAAWEELRGDAGRRAGLLEAIAAGLDTRRAEIVAQAAGETALAPEELAPEFVRMVETLRLFARTVRESTELGGDRRGTHEPASERSIGPGHALLRASVPLGPVAVFGASNFPLAYGVCGGDTASALAAGCPVVVKEHPAHPKTGRMIAGIVREAAERVGFAADVLGYVENEDPKDLNVATALVTHPAIRAVGFTGSVGGGLAIEKLAHERPVPIPAFCEMGSTNPVIVTAAVAEARGAEIGELLAASILSRHGQQCTCPGILVVPMPAGEGLVRVLAERLAAAPAREMLAPWVRDAYVKRMGECRGARGVRGLIDKRRDREGALTTGSARTLPHGRASYPDLLAVGVEDFAAQPVLHEEIFGPAAVVVETPDDAASVELELPNALTGSVFFDRGPDRELVRAISSKLADIVGRVIFNGVPTGVRVSPAMVHGGPWPASNRPETTAVGPLAIERWCRPVCWQNE